MSSAKYLLGPWHLLNINSLQWEAQTGVRSGTFHFLSPSSWAQGCACFYSCAELKSDPAGAYGYLWKNLSLLTETIIFEVELDGLLFMGPNNNVQDFCHKS